MAIVLPPRTTPAPPPATASFTAPLAALGGCATCCVRHYCAMYAPTNAAPPANCPFGPGPAHRRRD